MACSAGCSLVVTRDESGTSVPERVRTCSRAMSSGRERWAARSFMRTSMRRPPELYLPARTPPTRALRVVATSSMETPMSDVRARSGVDAAVRACPAGSRCPGRPPGRWRPAGGIMSWLRATSLSQSGPRTENSTGNPRWAVNPDWDMSWITARMPGMALRSRRNCAENCGLAEFALVGREHGDEHRSRVDAAAPMPPPTDKQAFDLRPLADHRFRLLDQGVGFIQTGADGRLQADHDQAQILGRDEFAGQQPEYDQRRQKQHHGRQQNQSRPFQTALQDLGVGSFQPAESYGPRQRPIRLRPSRDVCRNWAQRAGARVTAST